MGGFNEEFLSLPRDVLISVMKKHQTILSRSNVKRQRSRVSTSDVQRSTLLPHFIAIRNGDDMRIDIVRQGNEHVLGARFADANFFVREDVKLKLEEYRPKLSRFDLPHQTRLHAR